MTTIAAAAATSRQLKPPIATRATSAARIANPMIHGDRFARNSLNACRIVRTSAPYRARCSVGSLVTAAMGGGYLAGLRARYRRAAARGVGDAGLEELVAPLEHALRGRVLRVVVVGPQLREQRV